VSLDGFHGRETIGESGLTFRWTSAASSFLWVPVPGLVPREIAFRAKAPGGAPVRVAVAVGGATVGTVGVLPGDFADARLPLDDETRARMAGAEALRVELASPVFVPGASGGVPDPRELGVLLDRVLVR
jgi:hypothetical protein